jgi:hypothetical protein
MARHIDPSRAITGLATCFDTPSRDGHVWSAEHFDLVTGLEVAVPLRLNHEPIITSWGLTDSIGTVERFAAVRYPIDGLLILAEIGEANGFGNGIIRDIQKSLSFEFFAPVWSFSVGGWRDPDTGLIVLNEISLTKTPAYVDARVLAVGAEAVETWELLTEKRPVSR